MRKQLSCCEFRCFERYSVLFRARRSHRSPQISDGQRAAPGAVRLRLGLVPLTGGPVAAAVATNALVRDVGGLVVYRMYRLRPMGAGSVGWARVIPRVARAVVGIARRCWQSGGCTDRVCTRSGG